MMPTMPAKRRVARRWGAGDCVLPWQVTAFVQATRVRVDHCSVLVRHTNGNLQCQAEVLEVACEDLIVCYVPRPICRTL